MEIDNFLQEKRIAIAKHEGRMEIINKETEDLKARMKETDIKLRRLI